VRGAEAGATITVVSVGGSVLHRRIATADVHEIAVSTGLYVVVVGSEAVKTVVN
jgi:hypothetical protein